MHILAIAEKGTKYFNCLISPSNMHGKRVIAMYIRTSQSTFNSAFITSRNDVAINTMNKLITPRYVAHIPYSQNILNFEEKSKLNTRLMVLCLKVKILCEIETNNGRSTHAENGNFHVIQLTWQS